MDAARIASIVRRQELTLLAGRRIHAALLLRGDNPRRYPRHVRLVAAIGCARYQVALERGDRNAEHLRLQAREALRRLGLVSSVHIGLITASGLDADIESLLEGGGSAHGR